MLPQGDAAAAKVRGAALVVFHPVLRVGGFATAAARAPPLVAVVRAAGGEGE